MIKRTKNSEVNISIDDMVLEVHISGNIGARELDLVLKTIAIQEINIPKKITKLILDLSKVKWITPSGAINLICLCAAFKTGKLKQYFIPDIIDVHKPPDDISDYLIKIGFFSQLCSKANIKRYEDLIESEDNYKNDYFLKLRSHNGNKTRDLNNLPIIWPLQTIVSGDNQNTRENFQQACYRLIDHATIYFSSIFSSSYFHYNQNDKHDLLSAIYEMYKNVFEHSDSWGLTMIHARPNFGTYICCSDIGIGIRESVSKSPQLKRALNTDYDAIKWALIDGNSSKISGNGAGMSIIEDFALKRTGMFEIRSGECLVQRTTNNANRKYYKVPWFPGTQINIFIPIRNK